MKKQKFGRRPDTRLLLYAEKWLLGSTRTELAHDERAIWTDFLSLAAMNRGQIDVYSREQLASQLCAPLELINRSVEKFVKTKKIKRNFNNEEKKEIFRVLNWEKYQPQYLWTRPGRLGEKRYKKADIRSTKTAQNDAYVGTPKEKKGNEKKGKEKKEGESPPRLPKNIPFKIKDKIIELKTEIRHQQETMSKEPDEKMKEFYTDNINKIQQEINALLEDCVQ